MEAAIDRIMQTYAMLVNQSSAAGIEEARAKDPSNPYVQANLQLLEESYHNGRAIQ